MHTLGIECKVGHFWGEEGKISVEIIFMAILFATLYPKKRAEKNFLCHKMRVIKSLTAKMEAMFSLKWIGFCDNFWLLDFFWQRYFYFLNVHPNYRPLKGLLLALSFLLYWSFYTLVLGSTLLFPPITELRSLFTWCLISSHCVFFQSLRSFSH